MEEKLFRGSQPQQNDFAPSLWAPVCRRNSNNQEVQHFKFIFFFFFGFMCHWAALTGMNRVTSPMLYPDFNCCIHGVGPKMLSYHFKRCVCDNRAYLNITHPHFPHLWPVVTLSWLPAIKRHMIANEDTLLSTLRQGTAWHCFCVPGLLATWNNQPVSLRSLRSTIWNNREALALCQSEESSGLNTGTHMSQLLVRTIWMSQTNWKTLPSPADLWHLLDKAFSRC